jgi:sterol-4alpha-carboxylate 3-dehydrogenase (decarboxylating)
MESGSEPLLGSVLVIGGSGFVGYHITKYFLEQRSCISISVLSRNPRRNVLAGVSYHTGDISNAAELEKLIDEICPTVIIHAACPSPTSASSRTYREIIVRGTRTLLDIALKSSSVKVFIYTSSATMAVGSAHIDVDETTPLADTDPRSHPYAKCKAIADKMVLNANSPNSDMNQGSLLTACIRLPIVYGERDLVTIPGCLGALENNQINVILGHGTNLWDFTSAENSAYAHHLIAVALMKRVVDSSASNVDGEASSASKVDGEAFNITDGERHQFWDLPRLTWKAVGWVPSENDRVIKLAPGFLLALAFCLEWLYWLFTFGQKHPTLLSRQQIEYSCFEHTYQIGKARERLGYNPSADFEAGVRKAVQWSLENDGWAARLSNCKSISKKNS